LKCLQNKKIAIQLKKTIFFQMCFFLKEFFLLFFQSNEKDLKKKNKTFLKFSKKTKKLHKKKILFKFYIFLKDQENLLEIF